MLLLTTGQGDEWIYLSFVYFSSRLRLVERLVLFATTATAARGNFIVYCNLQLLRVMN